jgi:hypothetical protein
MSAIIPPEGEVEDIPPPENEDAIKVLLKCDMVRRWVTEDGSTWWYADPDPVGAPLNQRAHKFMQMRTTRGVPSIYGTVLYVSPNETKHLDHRRDVWVPITGNTYPVKDQLKAIGARWDPIQRVWTIPQSKLPTAENIVKGRGI